MPKYMICRNGIFPLDCKSIEDYFIEDCDFKILKDNLEIRSRFLESLKEDKIIVTRIGVIDNLDEVVLKQRNVSDTVMEDLYEYNRVTTNRAR